MLENILYNTVNNAVPILLCVLGGIFAYKANVLNISLEGMMMAGAFVSLLTAGLTNNLPLAYLAAVAASLLLGGIFSFMGVYRKGNIIIIGLAINMLVPAVAGFVLRVMAVPNIALQWLNVNALKLNIPFIENVPVLGSVVSGHPPAVYAAFLLIAVMSVLMYRTRFGVHIRVIGENEDAAVSLGLKTNRYKVAAVLIGSVCCALAGTNLALERLAVYTNNMTAGRGFIAIAAIYCGRGAPVPSALYAILFGLARALSTSFGMGSGSMKIVFEIIPYAVMTIVLTVVSVIKRRKSHTRGAFV